MSNTALPDPIPLELEAVTRSSTPVAVLIDSGHPAAAELASAEAGVFPEARALFDVDGADTLFQFLVIAAHGTVRHIARLSGPRPYAQRDDQIPFFLTDLIDATPTITAGDVFGYYSARGIDLGGTASVESQVRLGEQLEPVRTADLMYMALFSSASAGGADAVLAHLNTMSSRSLSRVGLVWSRFMDRDDLATPTITADGTRSFDPEYFPVFIPRAENAELFASLDPFTPPIVRVTASGGADTRQRVA